MYKIIVVEMLIKVYVSIVITLTDSYSSIIAYYGLYILSFLQSIRRLAHILKETGSIFYPQ